MSECFFVGWIPNLSGRINLFADGANPNTERSLLDKNSRYNNSNQINQKHEFKSYFRYKRYLDDDALPDMALAFGNRLEKYSYRILKSFKLASSGIVYSSFVRAQTGLPAFLQSIITTTDDYKSFCGYSDDNIYLRIDFSQILDEECDGYRDDFLQKQDDLLERIEQISSIDFDTELKSIYTDIELKLKSVGLLNAIQHGTAYIFPNGLIVLRFSDWITKEKNGDIIINDNSCPIEEKTALINSVYELYSFLRDAWHFHRFHKDDDDLILKFRSFWLSTGFNFTDFKKKTAESLIITKENIHKSYILRQRPDYVKDDLDYLDLTGLALYLRSFCALINEVKGSTIPPIQYIHSDHFSIIGQKSKEVEAYNSTSYNFMLVWLGLFLAWISVAKPDEQSFLFNDLFSKNSQINQQGLNYFCDTFTNIAKHFLNFNVNAYEWMFLIFITTFFSKYIYEKISYLQNVRTGMSYLNLPNRIYVLMRALAQGSLLSLSRFNIINFGIVDVINASSRKTKKGVVKKKYKETAKYLMFLFLYIPIATILWGAVSMIELFICLIFILLPLPYRLYFSLNGLIYPFLLIAKTYDAILLSKINIIGDKLEQP